MSKDFGEWNILEIKFLSLMASYLQDPHMESILHARVVHVREIADVKIYWKHAWLGISYVIELSNSECICSLKFIKAKEDIKNMPFNFLVFFSGVKYWI